MEQEYKNKIEKIHLRYWLGIMGFVLFLTLVGWLVGVPGLYERINFAATFASLLLAIAAIGFAYVSNLRIEQNVGKLTNQADKITKATAELDQATSDVKTSAEVIPELVEDIRGALETTVDTTHKILRHVEGSTPQAGNASTTPTTLQGEQIINLVSQMGMWNLTAAYLVAMACDSDKSLTFAQENVYMDGLWTGTLSGVLTLRAFGLLDYQYMSYQPYTVSITQIDDAFKKSIVRAMTDMIGVVPDVASDTYNWAAFLFLLQNYWYRQRKKSQTDANINDVDQ